jgi:hypothetical protein
MPLPANVELTRLTAETGRGAIIRVCSYCKNVEIRSETNVLVPDDADAFLLTTACGNHSWFELLTQQIPPDGVEIVRLNGF